MLKFIPTVKDRLKEGKKQELTAADKKYNRQLASVRGPIEQVKRCGKIFRGVKQVYRGKHQYYSKTWNLMAGLVNLRDNTV